ncbi:hypothetical protein D2E23_2100 [Bifidobacterium callimiconis]|uniref:Uncharacterized protein n=1 Tax=Bifidobacterium callimiconis TaxID=2306973 RepID=A0A430F9F8_9BIFI|nr:hypothetical protein D2E23_2100 [Bifidobacterium callimiconis]
MEGDVTTCVVTEGGIRNLIGTDSLPQSGFAGQLPPREGAQRNGPVLPPWEGDVTTYVVTEGGIPTPTSPKNSVGNRDDRTGSPQSAAPTAPLREGESKVRRKADAAAPPRFEENIGMNAVSRPRIGLALDRSPRWYESAYGTEANLPSQRAQGPTEPRGTLRPICTPIGVPMIATPLMERIEPRYRSIRESTRRIRPRADLAFNRRPDDCCGPIGAWAGLALDASRSHRLRTVHWTVRLTAHTSDGPPSGGLNPHLALDASRSHRLRTVHWTVRLTAQPHKLRQCFRSFHKLRKSS